MMHDEEHVADLVVAALETEPRIRVCGRPLWVEVTDGTVIIEGDVQDIASKRRALARVAGLRRDRALVDRVQVAPAEAMQDGTIRDHLRDALVGEPVFRECTLRLVYDAREEVARDAGEWERGSICARVASGVVAFEGRVPSLSHKRLAEALAWWVPGVRDVRNDLAVSPPEEDTDDEISDAVRLVLEKEPLLDAAQLRVDTRGGEVVLHGAVPSDEQRAIAERDAWFVPGVREVKNQVEIGP